MTIAVRNIHRADAGVPAVAKALALQQADLVQ